MKISEALAQKSYEFLDKYWIDHEGSFPDPDFTMEFGLYCLESAIADTVGATGKKIDIKSDTLTKALELGHEIWCNAVVHIGEEYTIDVYKYGFLMFIYAYVTPDEKAAEEMSLTDLRIQSGFKSALTKLLDRIGTELIEDHMTDERYLEMSAANTDSKNSPKDGTSPIDQLIMSDKNANALAEFFAIFKEIGVFYHDPGMYKTQEEREKHARMMEIYDSIFCNSAMNEVSDSEGV